MATIPRHGPVAVDVPGFTNDDILGFLRDLVLWKQPTHILEVGCFMGRSATVMAEALAELGGDRRITVVDRFIQKYRSNYINGPSRRYMINRCGPAVKALYTDWDRLHSIEDAFNLTLARKPALAERVTVIKGDSGAVDLGDAPVQMALLDANKDEPGLTAAVLNILSVLEPDGVLIFDDYAPRFPEVMTLVIGFPPSLVERLDQVFTDIALRIPEPAALAAHIRGETARQAA